MSACKHEQVSVLSVRMHANTKNTPVPHASSSSRALQAFMCRHIMICFPPLQCSVTDSTSPEVPMTAATLGPAQSWGAGLQALTATTSAHA